MVSEEFLALSEDERFEWLNTQNELGRAVEDICGELKMTRAQLQVQGFTFALGEWHMLRMSERTKTQAQN